MYSYKETARKHAVNLILLGLSILIVTGILLYFTISQKNSSWPIMTFVYSLVAIPGLLMTVTALLQFAKGGEWNIQVTDDRLIWEAPAYLGESFNYSVSEIAHIEKQIRRKTNAKSKITISYVLESQNEQQHRLVKQSSVDIEAFVEAATKVGVQLNVVEPT